MSANLTFRLFRPGDMEGILKLWAEESGWGEITEEQFKRWIYTPFGECLISVASDESGRILGQQVFMPAQIYINGQVKTACRVLAPILSKEVRANIRQKDHPFYEMHRICLDSAVSARVSVIYTYPLHSWMTVMKFFPKVGLPEMQVAEYECWTLPRSSFENVISMTSNYESFFVSEVSDEFDALWKSASQNFPINCGMARDAKRLQWKLGGHLFFATKNGDGDLTGYVAFNKKTGLIVDMLARSTQEMKPVLASALKALRTYENEHGAFAFGGVGLMKTEASSSLIDDFGFEKTDFKFAFGCYSIDPAVSTESILPKHWYKMPDD